MRKQIILLLLVVSVLIYGQNSQELINNLKSELKTTTDAKKIASIYSDLTWYYANISIDSALIYGDKAIAGSTKLGDSTLIAQVYSDLGAVNFRKGDYVVSKQNYLKSYNIRKLMNNYAGMAKVKANLANIYNKEGNKELALKSYLESIEYFEKTGNEEAAAYSKANVGYLFHEINNFPKAKLYLNEAIAYQENKKLDAGLCTSYLTMGNVLLKQKDTVNAIRFYNKSIISSKKAGNNIALASAITNLGNIKSHQQKSAEANSLLTKSKHLRDKISIKNEESINSLLLVNEKLKRRQFLEAKQDLLVLRKLYEQKPFEKENLLETYQFLVTAYAYLNAPDSVNFYNSKAINLQSMLMEDAVIKQINEFEAKYQSQKKEKLLFEKELETQHKNYLILGVSTLSVLIALLGFLFYRQQRLKNKQQAKEFELKSAIAQIENQNKLQEQRLYISRDLHDNIGAQLTFIISSIDNLKFAYKITDAKINQHLAGISNFAKSTIIELRDTIWAMNSSEYTCDDLQSRMYNFIEKAQSAKENIEFQFQIDEEVKTVRFSSLIGMNLYRTLQEAINNAIKYSEANTIFTHISLQENVLNIEVKDNGKGFDLTSVDYGNGLKNMIKRMEDIGGSLKIVSKSENGTQIKMELKI